MVVLRMLVAGSDRRDPLTWMAERFDGGCLVELNALAVGDNC